MSSAAAGMLAHFKILKVNTKALPSRKLEATEHTCKCKGQSLAYTPLQHTKAFLPSQLGKGALWQIYTGRDV